MDVYKLNMYKQNEQKYRSTLINAIQNVDSGKLTKYLEQEGKDSIEMEQLSKDKQNSVSFLVNNKEDFIKKITSEYNSLDATTKATKSLLTVFNFVRVHMKSSVFYKIIHKTFSNNSKNIYKILFTKDIKNYKKGATDPIMSTIIENIEKNRYKYDKPTQKLTIVELNSVLFNKDPFTNQLDPFTQVWVEYIIDNGFRK
jgi:hypothetical protein